MPLPDATRLIKVRNISCKIKRVWCYIRLIAGEPQSVSTAGATWVVLRQG